MPLSRVAKRKFREDEPNCPAAERGAATFVGLALREPAAIEDTDYKGVHGVTYG